MQEKSLPQPLAEQVARRLFALDRPVFNLWQLRPPAFRLCATSHRVKWCVGEGRVAPSVGPPRMFHATIPRRSVPSSYPVLRIPSSVASNENATLKLRIMEFHAPCVFVIRSHEPVSMVDSPTNCGRLTLRLKWVPNYEPA